MSLRQDEKAILTVLENGEPKTFAQISLQAGEALMPALESLLGKGALIRTEEGYQKSKR